MPLETKVMLGEREYILAEKVAGVSMTWREQLRKSDVMLMFESLDDALNQIVVAVGALRAAGDDDAGNANEQWAAGLSIATVAPAVVRGLANSIDEVIGLLFDYSTEMAADREWILANVYNDDLIAAFIEVVKLNFPIGALWAWVAGSRARSTNTNLPSANGAGGHKKAKASGGTKVTSDQLRRR